LRLSFAECELDTDTRQLLRAGSPVHLTLKAYELLLALLEQRPRALSKRELRAQLWPDTHVLEANLPNVVSEAREALGDDARQPRFIRTVHGFGYAFCGEAVEEAAGAPAESPPGTPPGTARYVYRLAWEGGLVALAEGEYLLGRHPHSVVPTDRDTVSRRHARLRITGGQAVLEDLGSRNGTFVRGERLAAPALLQDGDEFRVGSVSITFRCAHAGGGRDARRLTALQRWRPSARAVISRLVGGFSPSPRLQRLVDLTASASRGSPR
jgi:DNA-binding winged helix-turn-helix (wHTH) protein